MIRIAVFTLLALSIPATVVAAPSPQIKVIDSDFFVAEVDDDGSFRKKSIPIVTYRVGNCYGWAIRFAAAPATVDVVEHFRLPAYARQWNVSSDGATKVGRRRLSAKTKLTIDLSRGVASNSWCIAEGDPAGVYHFVIKQRRRTIHEIAFNVGEVL